MKPITPVLVSSPMVVFLDFEASSLAKLSYPIEVAWVFEDGASETHLIQPAPQWTDWDGKWLSALLRAAKLPRHALRLRDSDEARAEAARNILAPLVPADRIHIEIADLLTLVEVRRAGGQRAHRALADAQDEQRHWLESFHQALGCGKFEHGLARHALLTQ